MRFNASVRIFVELTNLSLLHSCSDAGPLSPPPNAEELLINNNDLTGQVDDSLCLIRNDTVPGGNLGVFHVDCQPPASGGAPQIVCSCCTACFV